MIRNVSFRCQGLEISWIFGQIFGQTFDQIFGQVFDQSFGEGKINKYSVQLYRTLRRKPRKHIRNLGNSGSRFLIVGFLIVCLHRSFLCLDPRGRTFADLKDNEPGYVSWALRQTAQPGSITDVQLGGLFGPFKRVNRKLIGFFRPF